ncbi:MAG: GGDEF domain-containing protein [Chloroflexi bacterium]|nr:GGDEF domain-containing protein [Chloroflexota bacterium]
MTVTEDFEARNRGEPPVHDDTYLFKRQLWVLRFMGVALALAGWAVIYFVLADSSVERIIGTGLMGALGSAAFAVAITGRKVAVKLEKKLRLRLLIHNMELENLAMRDDLTGLYNRRYFFERLQKEVESAKGLGRPLAVVVMDIDSLKAINDTYGHKAGDRSLAAFGRFLLEETRATDIPARIGGDEFAVILPDTSKRGAYEMIERFILRLRAFAIDAGTGGQLKLAASFGLSGYPWGAADVDALVQQADAGMYAHKATRRKGAPADLPIEVEVGTGAISDFDGSVLGGGEHETG